MRTNVKSKHPATRKELLQSWVHSDLDLGKTRKLEYITKQLFWVVPYSTPDKGHYRSCIPRHILTVFEPGGFVLSGGGSLQ